MNIRSCVFRWAAVVSLGLAPSVASATTFAVLLDQRDHPDETSELKVDNPLYQDSGTGGVNPLYEPKSLRFIPHQLLPGHATANLSLVWGDDLPADLPPAPDGAFVFGIELTDGTTGEPITQFASAVDICLELPQLSSINVAGSWLGTLSELDPPEWECEDDALTVKTASDGGDLLCGKTTHFSYFYMGPPVPEPGTLSILTISGIALAGRRRRGAMR